MTFAIARLTAALIVGGVGTSAQAQPAAPAPDWKSWDALLGTWDADRAADGATGSFTLTPDLQGRILVRKNHADYPPANGRPALRHDDSMTIWRDGATTRATYWDNEGHVIHYAVTVDAPKKTFTFVSEPAPGPRFRLTYLVSSPQTLSLKFEIAAPNAPDQWKPYITATMHRAK